MIDPTAVIGEDVQVGEDVAIGRFVVVGDGTVIGDGCELRSHVVVGGGCEIGAGSVLHPHAVLYSGTRLGQRCIVHSGACIGPDGFGFAWDGSAFRKIPQVGRCRIGDDVEIGANSTIDRGSIGDTQIGDGCGLESLVHIGHNAIMGRSTRVGALAGVAGSAHLGDRVDAGAQTAIVGHLSVGDDVRVTPWGGITQDTAPGETISGVPGRPRREARRAEKLLARLPRVIRRILALEKALLGPGGAGIREGR